MDYAAFGKYLTQQRELRGLSREEVAHSTRIPGALIAALEEGELSRLPGRVFVVNYIRSYAEEIGLSPDEAVLRFEEVDQAQQEQAHPPPVATPLPAKARSAPKAKWPLWIGLLVLVAAVVVGALVGTGHLPLHLPRR